MTSPMTFGNRPQPILYPPGKGGDAIPLIQQFAGIYNAGFSKVFKQPDEAFVTDRVAAAAMLRDLAIATPLQARMLATALLPWHIEPDDKRDKEQVKVAHDIQNIIDHIDEFVKYRLTLLWGIWYGVAGVQNVFTFVRGSDRRNRLYVKRWSPVNGDSIRWSWSEPGKIAIQITPMSYGAGTKDLAWMGSDTAPIHFLSEQDREQFVIHRHLLASGDYFDPKTAGMATGIGLRHYVFWYWRQKQELMAMLSEYLERWGSGMTVAYYPQGNDEFRDAAQQAVQNFDFSQVITYPVDPAGQNLGKIERTNPDSTGIQNFLRCGDEYYNKYIGQFIQGQDLTSNSSPTGLGSGLSDLHASTFSRLTRLDALNLSETLSKDLVGVIQKWSYPETVGRFRCKFVIAVDRPNPTELLQASRQFWDMGGSLDEDQLRQGLGLTRPDADSKILKKPDEGGQKPNPFGGEEGAKPQPPQVDRTEGEWELDKGMQGGDVLKNSQTGAVRYAKELYAAADWDKIEDGPKGGKRWKNKNTGKIVYRDPSGKGKKAEGEAAPAKEKAAPDETVKEAQRAFSAADEQALDRVAKKLSESKGKRGGLGVKGLQEIARLVGVKPGKLKKDQLIETLVEKLGVRKKDQPLENFKSRIDLIKRAEQATGISFEDRLVNQMMVGKKMPDEYYDALKDVSLHGDNAKAESKNYLKQTRKSIKEELLTGDLDKPSRALKQALASIKDGGHGELTPQEAIDLILEKGKVDKIAPPEKKKSDDILPDDLQLAPAPRETKKEKEKVKEADYIDRLQQPKKEREAHIADMEKKTKTPFVGRVVAKVIADKILSPEARQKFEEIEAYMQKTGKKASQLPEKEMRFYKDYEAGQRYQAIQTKLRRSGGYISGDNEAFMNAYRGAILSRIQFDDALTAGPKEISSILETLSDNGYGSLAYDEFMKKAKGLNVQTDKDKFRKEGQ